MTLKDTYIQLKHSKIEKRILMDGIGAVILAAGQAKRFGTLKQFSLLADKPLFLYPVELTVSLKLKSIILVGNTKTDKMADYIQDVNINYITNEEADKGMSTSLKKGMSAVPDDIRAILLFLGDQPFIPKEVVDKMVSIYEEQYHSGIRIVRPSYSGQMGHPVLFDRAIFPFLMKIKGDKGAKDILELFAPQLETIDFSEGKWNMDIDTPIDYENAKRVLDSLKGTNM
jgi:molybdenum cofactor cytidylyltransferase